MDEAVINDLVFLQEEHRFACQMIERIRELSSKRWGPLALAEMASACAYQRDVYTLIVARRGF